MIHRMIDLNNPDEIKNLDPKDVYGSTGKFADQCQQIVDDYFDKEFYSEDYKSIKNIIICGMGGSAYGGHVASSLYFDSLNVPLMTVSDYHLPGFARQDSLVFLTSYSGSTEEVLSCGEEAKSKGINITGFTSGGKLGEFLHDKYPGFTFEARNNPSDQPRLGTGYVVTGTLVLLRSLGVISFTKEEINKAIQEVRVNQHKIIEEAQSDAKKMLGFIPVIFGSQHLVGNAHIIRNQLNETAKSFSAYEDIPELNHHLMEGFKNPSDKKLMAVFLNSDLYSEKHTKRIELTRDVLGKNKVEYLEQNTHGSTKLSQVLNALSYGGYFSLYLALLYGQDPSLVPWVDYFKEKLATSY